MDASVKLQILPLLSVIRLRDLHYLVLLYLIFICKGFESHEEGLEDPNYLLCKFCGADVADLNYVIAVDSPASLKTENYTLSGNQVFVQTVKNPSGIYFDLITVKKSNCVGYGEWSKANSWFPGYAWKVCICQPWNHFLGWMFEPHANIKKDQTKASAEGFYALIRENILTEEFSNSLLVVPKSFSS